MSGVPLQDMELASRFNINTEKSKYCGTAPLLNGG